MKKLFSFLTSLFLVGCSSSVGYETISAEKAKEMMTQDNVVIIDVREEDEYAQGHIPHATLIPLGTITENNSKLPDQSKTLLIYCRSGRRSKQAAEKFVQLGYENVYDFGGIIDWPYDIEK